MFDPRIVTETLAQYLANALHQHGRGGRFVRVTCQRNGDIDTTIEAALGTMAGDGYFAGCCVAVRDPDLLPDVSVSIGGAMVARYTIECWEEVLTNAGETGSGYSCGAWAGQVAAAIAGVTFSHLPSISPFSLRQMSSGNRDGRPGAVGYAVTCEVAMQLDSSSRPSAPTLAVSEDGTIIGLTCDWPTNAHIYYTLSEVHGTWPVLPGPGVDGAQLYTGPITVDPVAGYALLAIAYGPGANADWLPSQTITRRMKRPDTHLIDHEGNAITDIDGNTIGAPST